MLIEPVPIKLDVERRLKFNNRAAALAEREIAKFWGVPRVSLLHQVMRADLAAAELGILVWAGLLHEDRGLTLARAEELTAETPLGVMTEGVMEALLRYMTGKTAAERQAAGGPAENPPMNPSSPGGTGSSSGPSAGTISGSA